MDGHGTNGHLVSRFVTKYFTSFFRKNKKMNVENIYLELKKLFILRKNYVSMPIRSIQDSIIEITKYELYDKMTEREVEDAIKQVMVTDKFKQSILSDGLEEFFVNRENNLRNGLEVPFKILSNGLSFNLKLCIFI